MESFYSTAVLNLISWDKAYCLYPQRTLDRNQQQVLKSYLVEREEEGLRKYVARGFSVALWNEMEEAEDVAQVRRVGDKSTWVVKLPPIAKGRAVRKTARKEVVVSRRNLYRRQTSGELEAIRFGLTDHGMVLMKTFPSPIVTFRFCSSLGDRNVRVSLK